MPFGEIGAFLLFLAAVLIFGNLWFHFIETILSRLKKIVTRRKEPPAWHIQNHVRKLLPRPPRNQGQSKQYHQVKQLCNKKREAPVGSS